MIERAISLDTFAPPLWEFYAGLSHYLLRQYDEALTRFNRVIEQTPKFVHAYDYLACAYVEMNRLEDARDTIKAVLKIKPEFTLKDAARIYVFRIDEDRNRVLNGLREAGVPEG